MRTQPFVRFLDTAGDGTGTKNAIADYSGTADDFYIAPPAAQDFLVTSLKIHIGDGTIVQDEYAGIGAALTTGIAISAVLGGSTVDLLDGIKIKTNSDIGHFTYDYKKESWTPTPSIETLHARWHLSEYFRDGDAPPELNRGILLQGHRGDKLVVTLNDDLTGILDHHFIAFGVKLLDWISARNAS